MSLLLKILFQQPIKSFFKINAYQAVTQQAAVPVIIHVDQQLAFAYISMIQHRVDDLEQ
jgi:hypothetical protein